jgi:hypothetical protein
MRWWRWDHWGNPIFWQSSDGSKSELDWIYMTTWRVLSAHHENAHKIPTKLWKQPKKSNPNDQKGVVFQIPSWLNEFSMPLLLLSLSLTHFVSVRSSPRPQQTAHPKKGPYFLQSLKTNVCSFPWLIDSTHQNHLPEIPKNTLSWNKRKGKKNSTTQEKRDPTLCLEFGIWNIPSLVQLPTNSTQV